MKEGTLRGRARPLPAAGMVVLWLIACCCRLENARGFSLRVDEEFRVENKFKQPINFIINGQEAPSLKFLKTSDLARFGEQYTFIAMEWNRSPNETVDYTMYFGSENTTVLETPEANTPEMGCVPSTNYTSFRMSLPCTGKSDEAIAFEAYLNYTITSYPYTVDNFKANLNHLECSARQGNLTGGHVTKGSTVLSMVKICALATTAPPVGGGDHDAGLSTPELAGIIAGSVAALLLVILLIQVIVRCQTQKTRAAQDDAEKGRSTVKRDSDRFSDTHSSFNPQYSHTSVNGGSGAGTYVSSLHSQQCDPSATNYSQNNLPIMMKKMCDKWMDSVQGHIVPRSAILVGDEIGRGAFGRVCIGNVIMDEVEEPLPCAIKTLKAIETESDVDEFLEEAVMLKDFKHQNVMSLLAVALDTEDLPMVCLEYMHYGDLRTYLRKMRGSVANLVDEANSTSSTKVLLSFCTQVAQGMDYLSSLSFVHRDLAARNCMLNKDLVVKIGDFGLARDIEKDNYYRMGTARPLPVKWMSFESLTLQVFTVQSDVWAFGVVMWEIFSLGITPYVGVANHEMLEVLKQNIRLPPPDDCPVDVYRMMMSCWVPDPEARPTFSILAGMLDECGERLYENMPVHKVQAGPDYMNYDPAAPGSIIRKTSANSLSSRTADPSAPYNVSLAPYNMDKYEMMGPAQKKLELTTVAETSPSDQPIIENQITGSGESPVLVIHTISPREINPATSNIDNSDGGNNKPPLQQQAPDAIVPPPAISERIITEQHYKDPPAPRLKHSPRDQEARRDARQQRLRKVDTGNESDDSSSSV
ncbi:tyrosine-protein kinase RYK-like [Sycon ciliatum]|uniref:tyrosine-protein kinase RYK-like n=1 Tax=Sycon ciliatum TaxID=27933 RepID=UPI0031F6400B